MRIAIDAMGGDQGFIPIVEGVKLFLEKCEDTEILLVGEKRKLEQKFDFSKPEFNSLSLIEGEGSVDMHISPSEAVKTKKNSTISVGLKLLKQQQCDAFISAGNTGVIMAFALLILGRQKNIHRPALACFLPTLKEPSLLIDVGANVDCKPVNLFQFGIMGSIYYSKLLDVEKPTIGTLSIGEEPTKGNEQILKAAKLFQNSSLNYQGNIEGDDILLGKTNIVVTDGFIGNILLKFGERMLEVILKLAGGSVKLPSEIKNKFSSDAYGAVPLLGVNGVVFVGHGKSSANAIKNALQSVRKTYLKDVQHCIAEFMEGI
ncbi:MAG: phosphate acyltransferase PlsX [bacterium]